ncbi:hypothetical protein LOTGIDRAFT_171773 [Lottia gigantea]|uniref:Uncharacterized protein n=1 Tax=Lottia gigantea TaxID=225164 RepID=V4AYJ8_LOTGI|nr:hypothetical protein LOTGIDRAFT_171773 [Lottia gigantea]ESP02698.1 hypothetical protein LOTGIDRAFT_171773 [Lottia gigantea]
MFTWIKKRCRRNSAPSCVSNKKSRHSFYSESPDAQSPHYFEVEDEQFLNHSYEEIPEIIPSSCLTTELAMQVTSLTDQLLSGISSDFDKCFICGKSSSPAENLSKDTLCTCYSEPLQVYENEYADIPSGLRKRSFDDYDIPVQTYSCDHVYLSLATNKRRRLFRSRSDIRKRPLPQLPSRQVPDVTDDFSDTDGDSSGFYENIDSDSDSSVVGPYMSDSILV